MSRLFTARQILNITSRRLCTDMYDIRQILSYMTGTNLYGVEKTASLPFAADICESKLLQLYPQFKSLSEEVKKLPKENFHGHLEFVLEEFAEKHGNVFLVPSSEESEISLDLILEIRQLDPELLAIN
jgi:hypothetical protein